MVEYMQYHITMKTFRLKQYLHIASHVQHDRLKSSKQFREEARILISKYKQINLHVLAFLLKYNKKSGEKIRSPEYVITNAQETCTVIFSY